MCGTPHFRCVCHQIKRYNMAKFNFEAESAENFEQKCLCVLVLDTSGSMNELVDSSTARPTGRKVISDGQSYIEMSGGISRLDNLNSGLLSFFEEIVDDETTSQRLELSIITFNDSVRIIQEPALPSEIGIDKLSADGKTAMVDAVYTAIDLVAARKAWYKNTNQPYYRPWIILITDGEPSEGQDIAALARRIQTDTQEKRYTFLPIGVDNANMSVLKQIQGTIPPMPLRGTKFSSFFKWLSASMGTVVSAKEGDAVDLSNGANDWMEAFKI